MPLTALPAMPCITLRRPCPRSVVPATKSSLRACACGVAERATTTSVPPARASGRGRMRLSGTWPGGPRTAGAGGGPCGGRRAPASGRRSSWATRRWWAPTGRSTRSSTRPTGHPRTWNLSRRHGRRVLQAASSCKAKSPRRSTTSPAAWCTPRRGGGRRRRMSSPTLSLSCRALPSRGILPALGSSRWCKRLPPTPSATTSGGLPWWEARRSA
mmetsp:Transcript_84227/g.238667  ORF Transcript_84227/g.238667 Transcript_84227/m.238667 type:complete len:214 (-) Transcript_84227:1091-1732(-)